MFNLPDYYKRLKSWNLLKSQIEHADNPFGELVNFYRAAPLCSKAADPYDQETWPDPWEQVEENIYCPFTIVLAMYYTLKLSRRFSGSRFEIHIGTDTEGEQILYALLVDGVQLGLWDTEDDGTELVSKEVHFLS